MSLPDEAMKLKDGKIIYDQLASMVAVQYSEAESNPAGSYVIYNGSVYLLPNGHIANTSWANTEKEGPTNIGAEHRALKTEIVNRPEEKDSSERTADLDISDPDGNVLARFQGGDFEVKNFSTKKALTVASETTDGDADLYITDEDGNGIFRLHNGHVQTKNFSTDCTEYKQTFVYSNTSGTKTIERFFPAGTTLVFHLADNASVGSDSISNSKVTYSYKDRSNQTHEIGQERGYNYFVYKLPSDAVSVSVAYGSGLLWGESGTLAFSVFAEATVITKPKVVTLDVNGGKDFTSLRSAVESVASLASEQNPYEIHIYPGTYNVYNDYTDAEIGTAGFVGLMITNGISLIGIGSREQIIISGEISTSTYDATKRNDISTLNIKGNVRVENMTIIAKNIRYAIHDDFVTMAYKIMDKHIYKNLKCIGVNLTTGEITFGAGGSNNRKLYATDCEFEGKFLLHNSNSNDTNYHVYLDNCSTTKFTLPDYNAVNGTYVHLRNCKAMFIELTTVNAPHSQSMFIDGEGTCDAFVSCPSGYIYNTGDCVKVNAVQIQAGYAVKAKQKGYHSSTPHIEVSTDSNIVYGVSIGTDNGSTIVQRHGYINSNTLGLSGLSVGDFLTIDNTGAVVSGGTSANAIAKVVYIDEEGIAYAKLTI